MALTAAPSSQPGSLISTAAIGVAVAVADTGNPDIRNPVKGGYGAYLITPGDPDRSFSQPEPLALACARVITAGGRLVYAPEAPVTPTVGRNGVERPCEAGYESPWFRESGSVVTVLNLSQAPYVLDIIATRVRDGLGRAVTATVDPVLFAAGGHDILLAEAFVPGRVKTRPSPGWSQGRHVWDAYRGATAINRQLTDPALSGVLHTNTQATGQSRQAIPVMNLAVTAAIWADMDINPKEIRLPGVAVRP